MQEFWLVRLMRRVDALLLLAMVAVSAWVYSQGGKPWNSFSDAVFCGLAVLTAWAGLRAGAQPWLRRLALAANLAVTVYTVVDGIALVLSPQVSEQIVSRAGLAFVFVIGVLGPFNAWALRRAGLRVTAASIAPAAADAAAAPTAAVPRRGNYFLRHWRGQLSLWVTFWINGFVFGLLFLCLHAYVSLSMKGTAPLQWLSLESVAALALGLLGLLWWGVGMWRCADRRLAGGWARKRALMVQIMLVCLAWLTLEIGTTMPWGPVKDLALLSIGKDVLGGDLQVKPAPDGKSVILVGFLHLGAAERARQALDAAPQAKTVVLSSPGGRLQEGELLANLVKARGLDTYVDEYCASACTYAFLAGHERAATPNARIGFHRPFSPFGGKAIDLLASEDMMDRYREAGLPDWFIKRIADTPSETVWYPTQQQLVDAKVVTRMSLGGEANRYGLLKDKDSLLRIVRREPIFQAYDRRFPGTIDRAVAQGWAVQQRGGNDGEIMTAMRGVVAASLPGLLQETDVPGLERFSRLVLSELNAARAVSPQACVQVTEGSLDITMALPPAIAEEEVAVVTQLLDAPPTRSPAPRGKTAREAMRAVSGAMPASLRDALTDEQGHKNQPGLLCNAYISFYETLLKQPPVTRDLALQAMFRGEK
ncbi:ATP-dependent Clp protease proteolytic subunit [Bordetella sp. N]|uniref:ATP-dependent Clp protease proteolytic subunit n=1 Tax=Bordetella sp. N TaxID=1746199 RepID=UPI00070F3F32|nr:ATP-dependent Clp protease proteolytic subunit [Bordetella sp. N]ALM82094.1 hypothetical protein ASB57_03150 [Bordetella sp. N]